MNLIILILLCFKFIGIKALADGIPKIYLYYDEQEPGKYVCTDIFDPVIITDEQFYVYVESKNPVDTINRLSCYMNGTTVGTTFITINEDQQYEFLSNTSLPSDIEHIDRVTPWYCTFYTHNCDQYYEDMCMYYDVSIDKRRFTIDNGVKCSFKVKVKTEYGQIMGSLRDNGQHIMNTTTNDDTILTYYDRSQHNFTCISNRAGYLKFIYTSQNETKTSTGWFGTSSIDWYMKLSADNHNATLECHLSDITMAYTIVLRVRLQLMENNPAPGGHYVYPGFDVNGLVLSRLQSSDRLNHHYEYLYYDQELLNITILKDNNFYSNFSCRFYGFISNNPKYGTDDYTSIYIQKRLNKDYGQIFLNCTIKLKNDNAFSKFQLKLLHWIDCIAPIKELSFANVISKYKKQNYSITPTVLIYEYNTKKNLTCEGSEWKDNDVSLLNKNRMCNSNICTFNLEEANKYYSVQCSLYWLQLIKKGQATPTSKHLGNDNTDNKYLPNVEPNRTITAHVPVLTTHAPFKPVVPVPKRPSNNNKNRIDVSNETISVPVPVLSTNASIKQAAPDSLTPRTDEDKPGSFIPLIILVSLTILIIVPVIVFVYNKRKNKLRNDVDAITYSTLQHNEIPFPTPTQWDSNRDYLYAQPTKNKINEPTYAEIGNKGELNYAELDTSSLISEFRKVERVPYVTIRPANALPTNDGSLTNSGNITNDEYGVVNSAHQITPQYDEPAYCEVKAFGN